MQRKLIIWGVGIAIAYYLWRHDKRRKATNPALTATPPDSQMTIQ
ncbi:hypothetical protein [Ralstonia pickettii]|nr:hypothetical protein [Ralstonia pickettii]